jgi:decaprenylphospho-beta-D-erythro-pentofuranosid-2-ulose 2-reductase
MKKILILGANSAIARAVGRIYAEQGHALYLIGRDPAKLAATELDLKVRAKSPVFSSASDLTETSRHAELLATAEAKLGGIDTALIAHGELGNQADAQTSFSQTLELLSTNFLSQVSLLTLLANNFEHKKSGTIAVITSVAGDRGRKTNYVYGTAKGALSIFLSGLRNRLCSSGVSVVDLRLGFVDTPMTSTFKKGPLWASPEAVGNAIVHAISRGDDIVYIPWFWRWIMLIIRSIPETLFKRLSL